MTQPQQVGSGQWAVDSRQWAVGSAQWAVSRGSAHVKRNTDVNSERVSFHTQMHKLVRSYPQKRDADDSSQAIPKSVSLRRREPSPFVCRVRRRLGYNWWVCVCMCVCACLWQLRIARMPTMHSTKPHSSIFSMQSVAHDYNVYGTILHLLGSVTQQ
jgi:hypothetical protein